jgi:Leucine Rich repeat
MSMGTNTDLLQINPSLVEEISLKHQDVTTNGTTYIIAALVSNTRLKRMSFVDTTISDENWQRIFAALRANTTLVSFYYASYKQMKISLQKELSTSTASTTTPLSWFETFVDCIKTNNVLKSIAITCYAITDREIELFNQALLHNNSVEFVAFGRFIINESSRLGLKRLAQVVQVSRLSALRYQNFRFVDNEASNFAKALSKNTWLTTVSLMQADIDDRKVQLLAQAMHENNTLTVLDLSNNQISGVGAQALAAVLRVNTTLTSLILKRNELGLSHAERIPGAGIEAFAKALQENTSLRLLDLSKNRMASNAATHFANAVSKNSVLESLLFAGNRFKARDYMTFTRAVRFNTTLLQLDLSGNDVSTPEVATRRHTLTCRLKNNRRRVAFITSPHGLKNCIANSLFTKSKNAPEVSLPAPVKLQLTQCMLRTHLFTTRMLEHSVSTGWCFPSIETGLDACASSSI